MRGLGRLGGREDRKESLGKLVDFCRDFKLVEMPGFVSWNTPVLGRETRAPGITRRKGEGVGIGNRCSRVRMSIYGEEFKKEEFETKGNTKLQDKLVQEIMIDIHTIVIADHIDFYVSSEIMKLRENLREKFDESRKRIHERGDMVARLQSANALYKWDKLVRDAEILNREAAKEARKEHEALDALINRGRKRKSGKSSAAKVIAPSPRDYRLALANVTGSMIATYFITAGFFRAVQTSYAEDGIVSIAQLGFLTLTVLLVFTSSLSMTLPRKY